MISVDMGEWGREEPYRQNSTVRGLAFGKRMENLEIERRQFGLSSQTK